MDEHQVSPSDPPTGASATIPRAKAAVRKGDRPARSRKTAPLPPAPPPDPAAAAAAKKARRKRVLLAVLGVVALGLAARGFAWWQDRQRYVTTDDAQVSGDLVPIAARIAGQIVKLDVDEGSPVEAGQVLVALDDQDLMAQVDRARAALAVARSGLSSSEQDVSLEQEQTSSQEREAEAGLRSARASANAARANFDRADTEYRRVQGMYRDGAATRQQFDAAASTLKASRAQYLAAQQQVGGAEAAVALARSGHTQVGIRRSHVDTTRAQIAEAAANLRLAQLQLAHATIRSPASGVVVKRFASVGQMVTPGQAVLSIGNTSRVWVVANVEETDIHRVRPGEVVQVAVDAFPHQPFVGHVTQITGATGSQFSLIPQNNADGNFTKVVQRIPVRIDVEDPGRQLKPGMSAIVRIDARG